MKKTTISNIILSIFILGAINAATITFGFTNQGFVQTSFAQVELDPQLKPQYAPDFADKKVTPSDYINYILQVFAGGLIYIAGPLAVLMLVWGGSSYVTSRGEQGATDKAKKTIIYAIAGLIVIMLSYAIVFNVIAMLNSTGG